MSGNESSTVADPIDMPHHGPGSLFRLMHRCSGSRPPSDRAPRNARTWLLHLAIALRRHRVALHEFVATVDGWDLLVSIDAHAARFHRALHDAVGCFRAARRLQTLAIPLRDDIVLAVLVDLAMTPREAGWDITSQILGYGERLPIRMLAAADVVELALQRPGIAPDLPDAALRRAVQSRCAEAALRCRTHAPQLRLRRGGPASSHT